jgi:hypothetical protein
VLIVAYVFSPNKTHYGVSDIHLLTNPPTLETSYHLLHSAHPDHYAIFLGSPSDPPGEIIYGEVQVPGGLEVGKGEKVISEKNLQSNLSRRLYYINLRRS